MPSHVKAITSTQISNWNTAYGWGNHAGLYVPLARTITINGTTFDLSANRTWTIPVATQYWQRTGTELSPVNSGDSVALWKNDVGIAELLTLRNDTTGNGPGKQLSFRNGATNTGYIRNEYQSGFVTSVYGRETVMLRTTNDSGTTVNDVLIANADKTIRIPYLSLIHI